MRVKRLHSEVLTQPGCIALAAGVLALTLAVCGLGGVAVGRGALAPPTIELRTGSVDLFAKHIWPLSCAPISECVLTQRPVYMVWVIVRWPAWAAGSYRLASFQLEHRK